VSGGNGGRITSKHFSPADVEVLYGVRVGTLANWRCQGRGPAYHKIGRNVFYSVDDLEAWERSCRVLTADSMLEIGHRLGIPQVVLAVRPIVIFPAEIQFHRPLGGLDSWYWDPSITATTTAVQRQDLVDLPGLGTLVFYPVPGVECRGARVPRGIGCDAERDWRPDRTT